LSVFATNILATFPQKEVSWNSEEDMAIIVFEESVGLLKLIHGMYRTALLNKKYYGFRLKKFKTYNLLLEWLIALGASGATGTGVAGLTIWKTGFGFEVWGIISAASIILATAKPLVNLPSSIERYSKLWSEYATMHSSLQQIEDELRAKNCLRTEQVEAFTKIQARIPELASQDDPSLDLKLVAKFENQVLKEVPVTSLWMPQRPSLNARVLLQNTQSSSMRDTGAHLASTTSGASS